MKSYGDIDSKFRFVILASKRAKQLLKGEKPKVKSKSKNLIRVAQEEIKRGLVKYEHIVPREEREKEEKEEVAGVSQEEGIEERKATEEKSEKEPKSEGSERQGKRKKAKN